MHSNPKIEKYLFVGIYLGRRAIELLSKLFEKKVREEELVQNGSEKQEASRPEHDLLKDLAHFMAKSQIERPSTAPRSHNRKKIQFLKKSMVQNKEAEDGHVALDESVASFEANDVIWMNL